MEAALPLCAEVRLDVTKVSQIDDAIRYLLGETRDTKKLSLEAEQRDLRWKTDGELKRPILIPC